MTAGLRIGVDARYLSHGLVGGVHTYVASVLPAMLAAGAHHRFVLYADGKRPFELAAPAHATVRTLPWRHAGSSIWTDWWRLTRWMARDRIDVAFFPANQGFGPTSAATVITLHDALNLLPLSETLRAAGHAATPRSRAITVYLRAICAASVRRATSLVTMSTYSRETIVAASGRSPDDIAVVPHGAPPALPVDDAAVARTLAAHGIRQPYVLADGLKNPGVILRAAARLAGEGTRCQYVFFARHAGVLPVLSTAVARGQATLLVRPATAELAALYRGAAIFAFPSWVEGFGIPLLEAMQYGAPVVASDRGAIPEVAGDAALYVDAEDDAGLADRLRRLLASSGEADALRARGRARVADFTWARSGRQTLAALEAAHARLRQGRGRR